MRVAVYSTKPYDRTYLSAIEDILGWGTLGPDGQPLSEGNPLYPGQRVITTQGIWYDLGPQQIHLLCLPNPDKASVRPEHGGRDRHVALGVTSIDDLAARLDGAGIPYTRSQSGRAALFCRDPDKNALEFVET